MTLFMAALVATLGLVTQDGAAQLARGPQNAAEHAELAHAIREVHPEATEWTLGPANVTTHRGDRDVAVNLPHHATDDRAFSYRSFHCMRLEGQLAWKCHPQPEISLVDVLPPAAYTSTPDTCSGSVRGIEVTPDRIPDGAIQDLVDFLAFSKTGRAAIAASDCGTPTPACVVSSIRVLVPPSHFAISVDIGPYEWLQLGLRRDCEGGTCRVHLLACSRWTS